MEVKPGDVFWEMWSLLKEFEKFAIMCVFHDVIADFDDSAVMLDDISIEIHVHYLNDIVMVQISQ